MNIQDLPLPLRLRNALTKAGFKTDDDLRDWFAGNGHAHADAEDGVIPGVGATGMKQLEAWATEVSPLREATATASVEPAVIEPRTFGELADGYGTLEEAVAKSTRRHEVAKMVDTAMRGGLEQLGRVREEGSFGGPMLQHSEIQRRSAEFTARGGSVVAANGRGTLILQLEADIQARIAALIPTIKALPHVKELGVEVSAETVGRMALIRGLDALDRAHGGGNGAKKGENRADQPENRDDPPVIAPPDDADVLDTPEGWTKVGPNEAIPIPEAVLHDYYTQNGWNRYWGRVDDQVIYFYWSPEKRLQDLKPFPGTDKSGRRMAEQATPWGPGHVVPTKWTNS
jgi:hypothetical protein